MYLRLQSRSDLEKTCISHFLQMLSIFSTRKLNIRLVRARRFRCSNGTPPPPTPAFALKGAWSYDEHSIMIPRLESIPVDVLSQIAFFTVSSTPFNGLGAVLQLLLCSRRIYNSLSLKSCPQLYARVFRTRFDLAAHLRRSELSPTTTSLALEFRRRCMVLRRIRRCDVADHNLLPDLWTIYLMLLESDGMNESQLHTADIAQYTLVLLKCHLGRPGVLHDDTACALAISIACLVWSHSEAIMHFFSIKRRS